MSLGNHTLSWPKWILCGRDFLSDEDSLELERRVGDWSADELIDAVTFLLERLKAAGAYEKYMEKTIGSLHSVNRCFENALCKIWRAGDIITTTNYDLQIEEAVGAEPISYSSPAEILSIIRGEGNKVIHLHGVYDKVRGMDNIIADGPQYKDILANAGAQFVQNLISTHTIVIVGCGGTVDDPNLSGFMNFVVKELGITNVPYFYLMKNGDSVPELPSNALPIYYGDDYSDLPDFLSELALVRLRERIGLRELAAFNPYTQTSTATTAFGRIHFSNGFNGFVGRDKELYKLRNFLENPDRILWWSLVGDGGIGKSRLVMEWLKNSPTHWFGFFARKTPEEAGDFKPFTDTVIVFDYVLGNTDAHIKNFSLLYGKDLRGLRLAPAYDLVSTTIYESSTREMSFYIGNDLLIDEITETSFRDAAAEIHLGERFAVGRYNFICNHFREALREAAAELQEAGFSKANEIEERILRTGGCAML